MKITTLEQLECHIADCKGSNVPLFTAYGGHGFTSDDTIFSSQKISIEPSRCTGTLFIHLDGIARSSLRDRHIGYEHDYNDNWWFTTEEEAKSYVGESK